MRFTLHHFKKLHGRLGSLSEVERLPSFTLDTPNIVFYTCSGSVPHLTYDVLQKLTTDILPMQYPLTSLYSNIDVIENSKISLHSFVGLPEYISYCSIQDPLYNFPEGYHRGNAATIKCRGGVRFVTTERYMELMECLQPDLYVSLYDCDTCHKSSNRRVCNSVNITNSAFSYCYEKHKASSVLKNKGFIAPIVGGYDLSLRERCAKNVSDYPVLGYLIDGLFSNGEHVREVPIDLLTEVISHTLSFLPNESLKIVHGAWDPHTVLKMVKLGVDIFDTTFPVINAENGRALVFNFNVPNLLADDVKLYENPEENAEKNMHKMSNEVFEVKNGIKLNDGVKKIKLSTSQIENGSNFTCDNLYTIPLLDSKYADDTTPLVQNCSCLTCRKHTRAYLHHLLNVKEMLAPVLLTIHNLHHYMEFFRRIRDHVKKEFESNCDN